MVGKEKIELYVERNIRRNCLQLFGIVGERGEYISRISSLNCVKEYADEAGSVGDGSFLQLSIEEATVLMNELWNAGVRPRDVGSPGELSAVKFHLEDMRKLVFETGSKSK